MFNAGIFNYFIKANIAHLHRTYHRIKSSTKQITSFILSPSHTTNYTN